jgi:hypothetical protein
MKFEQPRLALAARAAEGIDRQADLRWFTPHANSTALSSRLRLL